MRLRVSRSTEEAATRSHPCGHRACPFEIWTRVGNNKYQRIYELYQVIKLWCVGAEEEAEMLVVGHAR